MRIELIAALLTVGICTAGQAVAQYGPYGMGQGPGPRMTPYAMPGRPGMPPAAADSPDDQLRDGVNKLLGFMRRDEAPSAEQLTAFLDSEIAPFFDFDYMAQVAAGGMYRNLGEAQRAGLADKIKVDFLTTLTERLASFEDQEVKYLAARVNPDGRTGAASMAILNPQSYPARIDFRFYRRDGDWKVYDVLANGQSAAAHYRREFRQMLRGGRGGPGGPGGRFGIPPGPMPGGYR